MSDIQIQGVLQQMRALNRANGIENLAPTPANNDHSDQQQQLDFAASLRDSLRTVNELQQTSNDMQQRFEYGDRQTGLPDVMLAMSKASLAFEATNQVRNRLVSAYQEVMRMPV